MAKSKSAHFCQSCGYESPKWLGQCPSCKQWNTFVEEVVTPPSSRVPEWRSTNNSTSGKRQNQAAIIHEIVYTEEQRLITPDKEFNRVLGGGIVPGSLVLIGGEPGIGKSTLMLQLALSIPASKVLYISGEESEQQIKMRAERLSQHSKANCYILTETSTQNIFKQAEAVKPDIVVIDSIQTLHSQQIESAPGSVSQVRECTAELLRYAKETNVPVFIVGHITKDGSIAGPKVLEHMVDTVLQFEGDRHHVYRILRAVKNRFGSSSELGIYEMQGSGLREVSNPSEIMISQRDEPTSGVAIATMLEGIRPLMIEVQALVGNSAFGTPQRSSTGFDTKRLNMLLAVLEKRFGFRLSVQDVFLNITGGLRVEDPAIDLAVIAAIISSQQDMPLPTNITFAGEVGLSGEIRAVNRIEQRIAEAEKLGFEGIFIPKHNTKGLDAKKYNIALRPVGKLEDVFRALFG
ncbi:DNA repair protein RadA/Sms [Sphingobacterium alimentarium]|uniref:DNA repair protein RadA n=1 Tax=Sphingobacterium alimentarium TaxID=797292 RepID=A0A4R3VTZ0_9SPHI|nr:DNA repair protein RadA [Sphingobacterium alimentarium]TCV15211.1 DNA repair protein RadA/Sms [Sphingobacterium alimentarium]